MPTPTKVKAKSPAKGSTPPSRAAKPASKAGKPSAKTAKTTTNGTTPKVTVVAKTPPAPKAKAPKAPAADTLTAKLGIVTGTCVVLIDAPTSFPPKLDPIPDGVELRHSAMRGAGFDIAILFVPNVNTLNRRFSQLAKLMRPGGGLWVAWPSRMTDLSELTVRPVGGKEGLLDNKIIVIDQNWSAMRFVSKADAAAAN